MAKSTEVPATCIVCGEAAIPDTLLCRRHHEINQQTPCKDCTERYTLCQSSCKRHAEKTSVVRALREHEAQHKRCIPEFIPPTPKSKSRRKRRRRVST